MAAPETPTRTRFVAPGTPKKDVDQTQKVLLEVADALSHLPDTPEKKQAVLNSTLVFIHEVGTQNGLIVDVQHALHSIDQVDSPDQDSDGSDDDKEEKDDSDDDSDNDYNDQDKRTKTNKQDADKEDEDEDRGAPFVASITQQTKKILADLSSQFRADDFQNLQGTFVEQLTAETFAYYNKDTKMTESKLMTKNQIIEYADIFFHEIWGTPSIRRMINIAKVYNEDDNDLGDAGLATRTEAYGKQAGVPKTCRDVVAAFGTCVALARKDSRDLRGLQLNMAYFKLITSYQALINSLIARDKRVVQQLETWDVETGPGHTVPNQAKQFLMKTTGLEGKQGNNKFKNNMAAAQAVTALFSFHGGLRFAPFLPHNLAIRLRDLGTAKNVVAMRVYRQLCETSGLMPVMDTICEHADTVIMQPIQAGHPGIHLLPSYSIKTPLLEYMKASVTLTKQAETDVEMDD